MLEGWLETGSYLIMEMLEEPLPRDVVVMIKLMMQVESVW